MRLQRVLGLVCALDAFAGKIPATTRHGEE
jgi:hypothetical protein